MAPGDTDTGEILKVCALSRLNAPETRAEHHAYTTARQTLSSLVERIHRTGRETGPAPGETPGEATPPVAAPDRPTPDAPALGGETLRPDEPRADDLAKSLPEVAPEFRDRLLLVPPIL